MKALPLALLVALPALLAGCATESDARAALVPYPRMGDVATYEVSGALVEFSRWENGHGLLADPSKVRFTVAPGGKVLDAARAVHDTFLVTTEVAEFGPFVKKSERYVSPRHQGVVQGYYPLSQAQAVLSFDERGFPWLFGASALFGEDLVRDPEVPFALPDNLGRGQRFEPSWRVNGTETVDGLEATRLDLAGAPGMSGTLWMEQGSPWPVRARLAVEAPGLAPHVRVDGALPAAMDARRVEVVEGGEPLPPRQRGATFAHDTAMPRAPWDGEKPPDGADPQLEYPLSAAVAEARLLDRGLRAFLEGAGDARLYRGTYQTEPGPAEGTRQAHWLLQWVSEDDRYYEVQIARVLAPPDVALPTGAPVIEKSAPAQAPSDPNHGWFARDEVPDEVVPLGDAIALVRDVFEAQGVQVFLRSFVDPPGHSYFLDGGWERDGGRYTVVYNPNTGLVEHATGPVSVRFAR